MNGERVKMGIMGLDDMLGGGLIPGSICSIIGTYGTGKTTFSLEFAWDGLKKERTSSISVSKSARSGSSPIWSRRDGTSNRF